MIELPTPYANLLMKTTTGCKPSDSFSDHTEQYHDYNLGKILFGLISKKHGTPPWTEVRSGPAVLNLLGSISEGWGMDDERDALHVHAPYRNWEKGLRHWANPGWGRTMGKGNKEGDNQVNRERHTHMNLNQGKC